jgi:preprotein translocase subunit SecE
MGRLQRKKTPGRNVKKNDVAVSGSDKESTEGQGSGLPAADTSGPKKRQPSYKKSSAAKNVTLKKKNTVIDRSVQFLREVKVELKKVTWPSRKQTIGSTVVVIVLVMIISLFLGVVDIGLSGLIRVVLR